MSELCFQRRERERQRVLQWVNLRFGVCFQVYMDMAACRLSMGRICIGSRSMISLEPWRMPSRSFSRITGPSPHWTSEPVCDQRGFGSAIWIHQVEDNDDETLSHRNHGFFPFHYMSTFVCVCVFFFFCKEMELKDWTGSLVGIGKKEKEKKKKKKRLERRREEFVFGFCVWLILKLTYWRVQPSSWREAFGKGVWSSSTIIAIVIFTTLPYLRATCTEVSETERCVYDRCVYHR